MAYYGKLPVVLLSEIASSREDSYRCAIASYLLSRMGESLSVDDIARGCFISRSAVSRFCREIGLEDFGELRELVAGAEKTFLLLAPDGGPDERARLLEREACCGISSALSTLDRGALSRLVGDVCSAKRIACFELLKAETAAISLQCDLAMLGLRALTKVSYRDQTDFLARSREGDVIVLFSYRGLYFEYGLPPEVLDGKGKAWIVTGNGAAEEKLRAHPLIRGVLAFRSSLSLSSHPYQLIAVAGAVAQETAARLRGKEGAGAR